MKWIRAAAALVLLGLTPVLAAQTAVAVLCVEAISDKPPTIGSPGLFYNPAALAFRLDRGEKTPWPHQPGLKITTLDPAAKHLIEVLDGKKRLQSFRFQFSEFQNKPLCLWYDAYGGVQLEPISRTLSCGCKAKP